MIPDLENIRMMIIISIFISFSEYCIDDLYDAGVIDSQTLDDVPVENIGFVEIDPINLDTIRHIFTTVFNRPILLTKIGLKGGASDPNDIWEITVVFTNGNTITIVGVSVPVLLYFVCPFITYICVL